jgi:hypothetical protein
MDFRLWNGDSQKGPRICDRMFQWNDSENIKLIGECIVPHGYLNSPSDVKKYRGSPVFEIKIESGRMIISSLCLANDPIAHKFYHNLIDSLINDI